MRGERKRWHTCFIMSSKASKAGDVSGMVKTVDASARFESISATVFFALPGNLSRL